MFRFTETIEIASRPDAIWQTLVDIKKWWPPSNPEHISIDVRYAGKPIAVGTEIHFEERVAGIKGKASGSITKWMPQREAAWVGTAVYRYYGIPIRIQEGVSWSIESQGGVSTLSATVWAQFPPNLFGRVAEWYTIRLLNVIDRDREHARCELEYLKAVIETNANKAINSDA
ncbi:MAG: hypothetical protein PVJ15_07305 [Gammaproteobacteria bacterium]|jgi:hypothetical protein